MFQLQLLFWASIFLICYSFFGYLFVLQFIALVMPREEKDEVLVEQWEPHVTLLISAYNEQEVIEEKIKNCLELDYPKEKLEILVVSDASSDETDAVVLRFSQHVRLLRQPERQGKSAALNKAVPTAKGEIVIFSDANSIYDKNAIKELVRHFAKDEIGFVTGRTKYVSRKGSTVTVSAGIYTKLEILTKKLESKIYSCVGADGAIFAIRKRLYKSLRAYDINDFVIPLNVIKQNYRGIIEDKAFCFEETTHDIESEFNRQVRITCRTLRAIFNNISVLNPFLFPLFSFQMFSHKILRFMLPLFMMACLFTNFFLFHTSILYLVFFYMQGMFYFLFLVGYCTKNREQNFLLRMVYSLGAVSVAYLFGWVKYFSGETYVTWSSDRA